MNKLFKFVLLSFAVLLSAPSFAEIKKEIKVEKFSCLETDMDAKVNFPKEDWNGNTCAIIKVQTTYKGFLFDTGTTSVTEIVYKAGEIWVYVSEGVRKLIISHDKFGVCRYEIPVPIKAGNVYLMELELKGGEEDGIYVSTAGVYYGYLKMQIKPEDATVYIGVDQNYSKSIEHVENGIYTKQLDFGTYHYKIESEYYQTEYGVIKLEENTPTKIINLAPAYNYVSITSKPENGADVTINNKYYGKTPLKISERLMKGKCSIRLTHKDYSVYECVEELSGDGTEVQLSYDLNPQYATVTCSSKDKNAEIWIDNSRVGVGSWTGRLSSLSSHKIEARKENHYTQAQNITVANAETKSFTLEAPVPRMAVINVTTPSGFAKIYLDGEFIGETPIIKPAIMGRHEIVLMQEGYINAKREFVLSEGETRSLDIPMQKGVINVYVTLTTAAGADIYVDNVRKGNTEWSGMIPEGNHEFRTTKPYHKDGVSAFNILSGDGKSKRFSLPAPEVQYADLTVEADKGGAVVEVDGVSRGKAKTLRLEAGTHQVSVSKSGYHVSPSYRSVTMEPNTNSTVFFDMKKDYSSTFMFGTHYDKSTHFFEVQYGYGLGLGEYESSDNYLGFEYAFQPSGWGLRASGMFGLGSSNMVFTAGPALRLTSRLSEFDLQLYLGAGGAKYGEEWTVAYDGGFRFGFNDDDFSKYNFSLGAKYFKNTLIPTAGMSLFFFDDNLWDEPEYSPNYLDVIMGYGVNEETFHLGMTYAHVRHVMGAYATVMYEFDDIGSFAVGPVFRLNPDGNFDMQLYGGIGMNASSYRDNSLLGDVGIRLGWNERSNMAWWDLSLGCMFFGGECVPTIGLGCGLSLTALLTAGTIVACAMYL